MIMVFTVAHASAAGMLKKRPHILYLFFRIWILWIEMMDEFEKKIHRYSCRLSSQLSPVVSVTVTVNKIKSQNSS